MIAHGWLRRAGMCWMMISVLAAFAAAQTEPSAATSQTKRGLLHLLWGDELGSNVAEGPIYLLMDDQGEWTELLLDEELVRPLGGSLALNRKRVVVTGDPDPSPSRHARSRLVVRAVQLESPLPGQAAQPGVLALAGSQKFVNILCRFADSPAITPQPLGWFVPLMGRYESKSPL